MNNRDTPRDITREEVEYKFITTGSSDDDEYDYNCIDDVTPTDDLLASLDEILEIYHAKLKPLISPYDITHGLADEIKNGPAGCSTELVRILTDDVDSLECEVNVELSNHILKFSTEMLRGLFFLRCMAKKCAIT